MVYRTPAGALGSLGPRAMEPMNRESLSSVEAAGLSRLNVGLLTLMLSVSGVQVTLAARALRVTQTPPPADAMKRVLASVGSATIPAMRPVTAPVPGLIGFGPRFIQLVALIGIAVDGSVRSSSVSRKGM